MTADNDGLLQLNTGDGNMEGRGERPKKVYRICSILTRLIWKILDDQEKQTTLLAVASEYAKEAKVNDVF